MFTASELLISQAQVTDMAKNSVPNKTEDIESRNNREVQANE